MAWCRVLTSKISAQCLKSQKYPFLFHQNNWKCQAAVFHKYAILNTKQRSLEQEIKEDSDSDSDLNSQKSEDLSNLKLKILHAGLNYVPEHGWTKKSIFLGAQSLGLSSASHSLIQDGGVDLVHYFNFLCNENLSSYLREQNSANTDKKNIQEYLENALENRLRMVIPFVARWPEAMALMLSPTQFPAELENLLNLVDIIWCHSGSKSLNGTWYTKRIYLAMTYKLSELSLVQDKSPEYINSFDFLQRRVEMVVTSDQFIKQIAETGQQLPHYSIGALMTVRNILGINSWFR